jgi:hypothetical protein
MKQFRSFAVAVGLVFSTTINAQSNAPGERGIEALPRDVEMELAASALPAHLQEAATLYVLDPRKGFAVARKGTNGFHALMARTGDDAFRGSWPLTEYPPDVLKRHTALKQKLCKLKQAWCVPQQHGEHAE